MKVQPESLVVKILNQYRKRDIIAYLGLRYYFENLSARSNVWLNSIAPYFEISQIRSGYFRVFHFKAISENSEIIHRELIIPTPNECIAEAVLLVECSKNRIQDQEPENVFSYYLENENKQKGIFADYFIGLQLRQKQIAKFCEEKKIGSVKHIDIQNFYPSISTELALKVWCDYAIAANLKSTFKILGESLIKKYALLNDSKLPVGPLFTHFVANLVMRDLDLAARNFRAKYVRYVDDITLVGSEEEIDEATAKIKDYLSNRKLKLHDETSHKTISGSIDEWLRYRDDYLGESSSQDWMNLVGNIKRFLLMNANNKEALDGVLLANNFRLPTYEYNITNRDRSFISNFLRYFNYFRSQNNSLSEQNILQEATELRNKYREELYSLLSDFQDTDGFERKSRLPKIRLRLGRILYLESIDNLKKIQELLLPHQEFQTQIHLIEALETGVIDPILRMGTNICQAAAQLLLADKRKPILTNHPTERNEQIGLSIFYLYGHNIETASPEFIDPFLRFSINGSSLEMMKSDDVFISHIASLHGITENIPRHSSILKTLLTSEEDFQFDAISLLEDSCYM